MSIEAMKQWLEALELMYACYAHPEWISHKQQEEKILAQCVATSMTLRQAIADFEKQEPVAWMDKTGITHKHKHFEDMQPLYTHPQPKRDPLTDEQINTIFHELPDDFGVQFSRRFARAIEAAHGIKD